MRPTISVVLPLNGAWEAIERGLESLRPTLGLRDQVIAVDVAGFGSIKARKYSWVTWLSADAALDFTSACDAGAAVATGEVIVTLGSGTLLPARWLDGLAASLQDVSVGAAAPASNMGRGAQAGVVLSSGPVRMAELQAQARSWRHEKRGQIALVENVYGLCIAIRRDMLRALGGFGLQQSQDPMGDLAARVRAAGHQLVVARASVVHQPVQVDVRHGILLSACLIVKDEEDNLPSCLASLQGLVDEVVVYDTGSSDRTADLARRAGATVIEGYWDDDFARARNSALAHCRGEWILHVDADEVLNADATALRAQLASDGSDVLGVVIDNIDDGGGLKFSHRANRLFRRAVAHWHGRLHEQVVPRQPGALACGATTHATIRHAGYTTAALEGRRKHERNLRLARLGADERDGQDVNAVLNLGRALSAAGEYEQAVTALTRVRRLTEDDVIIRQSLRIGAEALLAAGQPAEALDWVAALRRHTQSTSMPDYLEGTARMNLGDVAGAVACFDRIEDAVDEEYKTPRHALHLRRGLTLAAAENWAEAASELTCVLHEKGDTRYLWAVLAEALWRAGKPFEEMVVAITDDLVVSVLAQLLTGPPLAADPVAELLWERRPGDPRVLAFALQAAYRLPLHRALEWSARVRSAGLDEECPLLARARSTDTEPIERMRAAAAAFEAFGDERGRDILPLATASVAVADLREALLAVDQLAPRLLPVMLEATSRTRVHCLAMAEILLSLGADEQAAALFAHAAA